jgi:lipopolysaccharide cholinephosphotransferase
MLETNALIRKLSVENDKLYALSEKDIRAVQKALLDMAKDFHTFCIKNGFGYFLCGGSALGAERHGGFIPWDEDLDIAMPRKDYDRFAAQFELEFGDKYHIQSIYQGGKYDLPFMKIRKKGTRFLELFEPEPEHAGLFVDIYPLENVPDFALWRIIHGSISDFLHLCCSCVRMRAKRERYFEYYDDPQILKIVKIKAFLGGCLGFFSLNRWCRMADGWASLCKNENSQKVSFPG